MAPKRPAKRPAPVPVDDTPPAGFVAPTKVTVIVTSLGYDVEMAAFDVPYAAKEDAEATSLCKAVSSLARRNALTLYVHPDDLADEDYAGGGQTETDPCAIAILNEMFKDESDASSGDDDEKEEEEEESPKKRARRTPEAVLVTRPLVRAFESYKHAERLFTTGGRCMFKDDAPERVINIVYHME
jgi:hypothetical protein